MSKFLHTSRIQQATFYLCCRLNGADLNVSGELQLYVSINIDLKREYWHSATVPDHLPSALSSLQDSLGPKINASSAINHVNTEPDSIKFRSSRNMSRACVVRILIGDIFCAWTRKVDQIYLTRLIFINVLIKYLEIIDNFFLVIPSNNYGCLIVWMNYGFN